MFGSDATGLAVERTTGLAVERTTGLAVERTRCSVYENN